MFTFAELNPELFSPAQIVFTPNSLNINYRGEIEYVHNWWFLCLVKCQWHSFKDQFFRYFHCCKIVAGEVRLLFQNGCQWTMQCYVSSHFRSTVAWSGNAPGLLLELATPARQWQGKEAKWGGEGFVWGSWGMGLTWCQIGIAGSHPLQQQPHCSRSLLRLLLVKLLCTGLRRPIVDQEAYAEIRGFQSPFPSNLLPHCIQSNAFVFGNMSGRENTMIVLSNGTKVCFYLAERFYFSGGGGREGGKRLWITHYSFHEEWV